MSTSIYFLQKDFSANISRFLSQAVFLSESLDVCPPLKGINFGFYKEAELQEGFTLCTCWAHTEDFQ